MRTSIMIALACSVFVAGSCLGSEPAEAADSRSYCLEYDYGGSDCSFTSLAQCNATASGLDAECFVRRTQAAMPTRRRDASRSPRYRQGM